PRRGGRGRGNCSNSLRSRRHRVPRRQRVDAHPALDITQLLFAEVAEGEIEPARSVFIYARGYANSAGLGEGLQTRRDVDAVAKEVAVLDHHVSDIDAHAELDPLVLGRGAVALHHAALHRDGADDRFDRAGELDQNAVAGCLDDAPPVRGDIRVDQLATV